MNTRLLTIAVLASGVFGASVPTLAQDSAQGADMQTVQQDLKNAREAVQEAKQVAVQIIADAKKDAARIRQQAGTGQLPADLTPLMIRNSPIAVEINAGTVKEIATAIMPAGWRVKVDVKDDSLLQRRFQFVSTKSRDQALRDLLKPLHLRHHYFFDLKDANGNSSPLLVISKS